MRCLERLKMHKKNDSRLNRGSFLIQNFTSHNVSYTIWKMAYLCIIIAFVSVLISIDIRHHSSKFANKRNYFLNCLVPRLLKSSVPESQTLPERFGIFSLDLSSVSDVSLAMLTWQTSNRRGNGTL